MSKNHHSWEYYKGYEKKRTERDEAKQRRKAKKRQRENKRKSEAASARYGQEAWKECTDKRRYSTLSEVRFWAKRHPWYLPMSAYRCHYCGGWHVTKHPGDDSVEL